MVTSRKPTQPTVEAIDQSCAQFDDLFRRGTTREAFRQYLIGLLLPREHTKTLTVRVPIATCGSRWGPPGRPGARSGAPALAPLPAARPLGCGGAQSAAAGALADGCRARPARG